MEACVMTQVRAVAVAFLRGWFFMWRKTEKGMQVVLYSSVLRRLLLRRILPQMNSSSND